MRKRLEQIKGFSDAKVDKIKDAVKKTSVSNAQQGSEQLAPWWWRPGN